MVRPCFLVIDREYSGSISTRKLVIETAKFNVITAYSGAEAVETLRLFPAVAAVVLDAGVPDITCTQLVAALKAVHPTIIVVAIDAPGADSCHGADFHLQSFDPKQLLGVLENLVPKATAEIESVNENLRRAEKQK